MASTYELEESVHNSVRSARYALCFLCNKASPVAQWVKNLPAIQETQEIPGWEDPLRWKWKSTPLFLPEKIPWTKEPGGLQSKGSQRVRHDWACAQGKILYNSNPRSPVIKADHQITVAAPLSAGSLARGARGAQVAQVVINSFQFCATLTVH